MSEDKEKRNDKGAGGDESVPTASFAGSEDGPGGKIGPYKLLSILGEGGFGIVYLAERQRPVKRRVALKVIKPGMDSKQVIARFETERQALALLDHPNIAQVFDAGTTKAGRPYFVMEHVEGIPINEHCDREKLSIEERLELFLQVCDAVQHAHQKGIIHRDIKPSNILITIEGDKAVPKIIDFGVAKAITQPLTERTLYTEQGQLIGTPEYMSPEQAEMSAQGIDTRSDIYSLGVMLYELLTGVLPFDRKTLEGAGFSEIQRIIREEDPARPSTKLTSLGEEAEKVAKRRHTEVATLARQLHKELEWIPLKAMRKERTHRYRTAADLADDIQNYLDGVPLTAGPESAVYQVKKFVRRNRAWVAGIAAVLVVLVAGIVVSMLFAVGQFRARAKAEVARYEAEQAREKEATSRAQAEQAREKEATARAQAEQARVKEATARDEAERQARISQAVANFLNDIFVAIGRGDFGSIQEGLDATWESIEGKFEGEPLVEAAVRTALGQIYWLSGRYKAAEPHLERAVEIRRVQLGEEDPATLLSMGILAGVYAGEGRYDEAEQLGLKVLDAQRRVLGEEHPDTLTSIDSLAWMYRAQDRDDEAEQLLAKGKSFGPQPPAGAMVSIVSTRELNWVPGKNATAHKVYFGTNSDDLAFLAEVTSPKYAKFPALEKDTVYYWRIDAVQADGSVVSGNVWSFTTGGSMLVGWWKFDEGSGTIASDSAGENNGTIHGARWTTGQVGGALDLDGTDDYVGLGYIGDFAALTICLWVNIDSLPNIFNSLLHCDGWDSGDVHFMVLNDGCVRFSVNGSYIRDTESVNEKNLKGIPSAPGDQDSSYAFTSGSFGQWHHIAAVYDSIEKTMDFYIDGQLDVQRFYSSTSAVRLGPLRIAGWDSPPGDPFAERCFKGLIDDVRIYNYALTETEVAAICAGEEPSPVDKAEQAKE